MEQPRRTAALLAGRTRIQIRHCPVLVEVGRFPVQIGRYLGLAEVGGSGAVRS